MLNQDELSVQNRLRTTTPQRDSVIIVRHRKAHQQRVFGGLAIIVLASADDLKTAKSVKRLCCFVSSANLEMCDGCAALSGLVDCRFEQSQSNAGSAKFRPHGDVIHV